MGRVIQAFAQFLDGDGLPLADGWLRFTVSGTNNTDKDTYADELYQIPNTNPVQLDAEGRCPSIFGIGSYRVTSFVNDPVLAGPGEQIQMFDPVISQGTLEVTGSGTSFDTWSATETYGVGNIVTHDLLYYRSLINGNLNLNPSIEVTSWERIDFLNWWNEAVAYSIGNLVFYSGNLWLSLTDANLNNIPTITPASWRPVASSVIEFVEQPSDYVMTSADRDKIAVLTSAAVADSDFTLPAMDASTDKFKVSIYNASDYILTIGTSGVSEIWLNSGGTLEITKGSLIELIYYASIDTWLPIGNVGPVLGNQDIGTVTFPVLDLHATDIYADSLTIATGVVVPTATFDAIHIISDGFLYFGDTDEVDFSYNSLGGSLDIGVAAGTTVDFSVAGTDFWSLEATGEIIPALTNPKPEIGSPTNSLDFVYSDNVSLPTGGYVYLGDSDQLTLGYTGTYSDLLTTAELHIGTTNSNYIAFLTNLTTAFRVVPDGTTEFFFDMYISGTEPRIHFGDPYRMIIGILPTNDSYIDITGGNFYFEALGSSAFYYNSSGITVQKNTVFLDDIRLRFGTTPIFDIFYWSSVNLAVISCGGTTGLAFGTGGGNKWYMKSTGDFAPTGGNAYDLGNPTEYIKSIYTKELFGDGSALRMGVSVFNYMDITAINEYDIAPPSGTWVLDVVFLRPSGRSYLLQMSEV